jgi:hypothetical protein
MSDSLHLNVSISNCLDSSGCSEYFQLEAPAFANMVARFHVKYQECLRVFTILVASKQRKPLTTIAASLILTSSGLLAGDQVPDATASALSSEGPAVVEERTLGATEGRSKAQESVNALSSEIQELKQSVIALNKDLRVLEEDLLFPANTQVNVFLSLDVGKFFTLESVKLKLDGKVVTSHIYTDKELGALARGGIHKLHMANLSVGEHSMSAFFTGFGPSGREYKRGTTLKINKENGPKYVELKINDSSMKLQPEFSVREW